MTRSDRDHPDEWSVFATRINESMLDAIERNVDAQSTFLETWMDTLESSADVVEDPEEILLGYSRAFEIWMEAAEDQFDEIVTGFETGSVRPEAVRDAWLQAANEAFQEMMRTDAFANVTGRTIEDALEAQQQADEAAEETIRSLGFAARTDIIEIGERLVELERRQHAVEDKLGRVLENIES